MSDKSDKSGNGAIDSCGNAAESNHEEEQNQLLSRESDLKAIEIISSGQVTTLQYVHL